MVLKKVEISVPEEMIPFIVQEDSDIQLIRNAMLIYPYIQNNTISTGRAAEILGVSKIDLIILLMN